MTNRNRSIRLRSIVMICLSKNEEILLFQFNIFIAKTIMSDYRNNHEKVVDLTFVLIYSFGFIER